MGENRSSKRHRWRLPCELVFDGGRQRAFVLDLSETGLFVQTRVQLRPGSPVEVRLVIDGGHAPIVLQASVARAKQVPSQLTTVAHGGIGLSLRRAPREYLDAIATLQGGGALRAQVAREEKSAPAGGSLASLPRFRVRVQQCDGPRSRTIEVTAETPEQARAKALTETGAGWEVARVEPLAR